MKEERILELADYARNEHQNHNDERERIYLDIYDALYGYLEYERERRRKEQAKQP